MNGVPNLDSVPKVESGKETPISDIAIFWELIPIQKFLIIETKETHLQNNRQSGLKQLTILVREFQMTCYRSKPSCPTKVSEGVAVFGVSRVIHGHLGVVLKRSYTENDTVLLTSLKHNTYKDNDLCFHYHPRSSLTLWAVGGNLCLAQNYPRPRTLSSCPSCMNAMRIKLLSAFTNISHLKKKKWYWTVLFKRIWNHFNWWKA